MRLVDQGKIEIIIRPNPEGPALIVLKIDHWQIEVDLPIGELLQLTQVLPIKELLAAVISRFPKGGPA